MTDFYELPLFYHLLNVLTRGIRDFTDVGGDPFKLLAVKETGKRIGSERSIKSGLERSGIRLTAVFIKG